MNSITTFFPEIDSRSACAFSVRPSWLVRFAALGRLGGEESFLIGAMQDVNAESGEAGISYGIGTDGDVARIETDLGSPLEKISDDGETIQASVRVRPSPARLVNLARIPEIVIEPFSVPPPNARLDPNDPRLRYVELLASQRKFSADFARRREAALKLRQRWNASAMTHRSDWPLWLPDWVKETIIENSRVWLLLNAGTPPPLPAALSTLN